MVSITDVKQWHSGLGFITTGKLVLTGEYATGGDEVDLASEIRSIVGGSAIDSVIIGMSEDNTAFYDSATGKIRVFKIASGVFTELANEAAYDEDVELPFVAYSR